jgi:Fe-S cluster biogenesis protein NfuA
MMVHDKKSETTELRSKVEQVIDLMRPSIQSDGGDIELVSVSDNGQVQIRFHGACIGCPSSNMTLQSGIERNLRAHVPGFHSVEAVDEHGRPASSDS